MHSAWIALAIVCMSATLASAQTAQGSDDREWSIAAQVYTYLLPDDGNYAQPTFAADRDRLHLEARFNYEALDTGSVWVGYSWTGGTDVAWEITPMLGGVFGDLSGVAPGYSGSVSWWKLDMYSEGELVVDMSESEESFLYNWSEVAIAPLEWLRTGIVTQRTRAYKSDREIQRGLLAGVAFGNLEATTYVFNPDDEATLVLSVGWSF